MSIHSWLRTHTNSVLIVLAVLFLALIIGYFFWGVGYLVTQLNQANAGNASVSQQPSFNFKAAAALDYRGIAPQAVTTSTGS